MPWIKEYCFIIHFIQVSSAKGHAPQALHAEFTALIANISTYFFCFNSISLPFAHQLQNKWRRQTCFWSIRISLLVQLGQTLIMHLIYCVVHYIVRYVLPWKEIHKLVEISCFVGGLLPLYSRYTSVRRICIEEQCKTCKTLLRFFINDDTQKSQYQLLSWVNFLHNLN